VGTASQYPTVAAVRKAVQALLLKINSEAPQKVLVGLTLGTLVDRYIQEELQQRYSTRVSYLSALNRHIKPKWGDIPLDRVKAMAVEDWLKQLDLAAKTKAHIRSLMHLLFRCAERWELMETGKNPIRLVRVKNCTKRLKRPRVLTVEEFYKLLPFLREPYRTMAFLAMQEITKL
jgi:integrase